MYGKRRHTRRGDWFGCAGLPYSGQRIGVELLTHRVRGRLQGKGEFLTQQLFGGLVIILVHKVQFLPLFFFCRSLQLISLNSRR